MPGTTLFGLSALRAGRQATPAIHRFHLEW
jgi:hypothetical protein